MLSRRICLIYLAVPKILPDTTFPIFSYQLFMKHSHHGWSMLALTIKEDGTNTTRVGNQENESKTMTERDMNGTSARNIPVLY